MAGKPERGDVMFGMLGVPGLFTTHGDPSVIRAIRAGEPVLGVWHGGGLLGAVQAAFIAELCGAGLRLCRYNAAASAGAFNMLLVFSDTAHAERMIEGYRYTLEHHLLTFSLSLRSWSAHVAFARDELVDYALAHVDEAQVRAREEDLYIVATNHGNGRAKIFCVKKHGVRVPLQASVSIQGACPPVQIGGRHFSDGAPRMQVRCLLRRLVRKAGIRHILIVMTRPLKGSQDYWGPYLSSILVNTLLANESPELRTAVLEAEKQLTEDVLWVLGCEDVKTLVVAPSILCEPLLYSLWTMPSPLLLQWLWDAARISSDRIIKRALVS